jgi:threonine/homoserine/homoserine lactone efflux protein
MRTVEYRRLLSATLAQLGVQGDGEDCVNKFTIPQLPPPLSYGSPPEPGRRTLVTGGTLTAFSLVALGTALVPGPNMMYVLSQSLSNGSFGVLPALSGVTLGSIIYMLAAAFGLTGLVVTIPHALDALRIAGAAYLAYLALNALIMKRHMLILPCEPKGASASGTAKIFCFGIFVSLSNPAVALLYLVLLPQFVDPAADSFLTQTVVLGTIDIAIGILVNALVAIMANRLPRLAARPRVVHLRQIMISVIFAVLAFRVAFASVLPPLHAPPGKEAQIPAIHEVSAVPYQTDRRVAQARGFPGLAIDARGAEQLHSDCSVACPCKSAIEGAQRNAQSIPLLARKFRQGTLLATLNEAPESHRCFGTLVDMRVKWQERKEWQAIELIASHPKPVLALPIPHNHMAAIRSIAKNGRARPVNSRTATP